MSNEAQLILDVWEAVRDHLPHGRRPTVALDIVNAFQEYGFEGGDCASIVDEDPDLADAFTEIFTDDDDDEEN